LRSSLQILDTWDDWRPKDIVRWTGMIDLPATRGNPLGAGSA
jgi:hypothetical protein